MANAANIKRYTAAEIQAMRDRGEDRTDWHRLDTMTEAELEAAIASDPNWKDIPADLPADEPPLSANLQYNVIT
jgi:hypothetical protein